ncbi:MAG: ABC transporter permease [Erysipelotrichaceae bacterium]|nr:ABC transporter permease [Erysipelotrichaceae bacterium]
MSKAFFPKLAIDNIKNNTKTYLPFLLATIGMVAMFYDLCAIAFDPALKSIRGGTHLGLVLSLGIVIVSIFALVFIFYTNSFLVKRRIKEFGLYNILGLEKKHISIIMFFEAIISLFVSLVGGLVTGFLLSKFMKLLLAKIIGNIAGFRFEISMHGIFFTVVLFGFIFFLTYLYTVIKVYRSKPIDLLKGSSVGEKEPKVRWVYFIFGLLSLASGYYLALTIQSPLQAFTTFFIAVILVIFGTYALFIAVSIFILKLLKKNKNFYYRIENFTSISSLMYRMKQNAVGLSNICILSTMVLVVLSTTISLYVGVDSVLKSRYPFDVVVVSMVQDEQEMLKSKESLHFVLEEVGVETLEIDEVVKTSFYLRQDGNQLIDEYTGFENNVFGGVIPLDYYNALHQTTYELEDNELLIFDKDNLFNQSELIIMGKPFSIKQEIQSFGKKGDLEVILGSTVGVVVKDVYSFASLVKQPKNVEDSHVSTKAEFHYQFNIEGSKEEKIAVVNSLNAAFDEKELDMYADGIENSRDEFNSLYGGLFFLGISLGTIFMMATVLIIYYKQIQEGFEDQKRFEIMQQVGMDHQTIKHSINKQVLIMFFLPLLLAMVHVAFAFPMTSKLLMLFGLVDKVLFVLCVMATVIVFAIIYTIVYIITSKVYYGIVKH